MRVYGPYQRKDGRKHVILIDDAGKRRTVSYPRWLVESHLGRQLLDTETVDHVDRDVNNNDISNLQILDRAKHSSLDVRRVKYHEVRCVWCDKAFMPSRNQYANRLKDIAGPFCSRLCSGIYGKHIQNGGKAIQRKAIERSEYTLKQEPNARKGISGGDDIGETFNNGNPEGTRKGHRRD